MSVSSSGRHIYCWRPSPLFLGASPVFPSCERLSQGHASLFCAAHGWPKLCPRCHPGRGLNALADPSDGPSWGRRAPCAHARLHHIARPRQAPFRSRMGARRTSSPQSALPRSHSPPTSPGLRPGQLPLQWSGCLGGGRCTQGARAARGGAAKVLPLAETCIAPPLWSPIARLLWPGSYCRATEAPCWQA